MNFIKKYSRQVWCLGHSCHSFLFLKVFASSFLHIQEIQTLSNSVVNSLWAHKLWIINVQFSVLQYCNMNDRSVVIANVSNVLNLVIELHSISHSMTVTSRAFISRVSCMQYVQLWASSNIHKLINKICFPLWFDQ